MAERISLRDYQRDLAARLRAADSGHTASKLAVQVGSDGWLVDLTDAGEVIPVPPITAVAQTRPWFKGVANVRGNLYSVVDFSAFLGGNGVALGEQARLLLLAGGRAAWLRSEYEDEAGVVWKELDVAELVRDADFLAVGT